MYKQTCEMNILVWNDKLLGFFLPHLLSQAPEWNASDAKGRIETLQRDLVHDLGSVRVVHRISKGSLRFALKLPAVVRS